MYVTSVRNEQSSSRLHSVVKTRLGYQVIIKLPVLQNTGWDPATFYWGGWVLCWRGNFTALQSFPWCVTENACATLHKPPLTSSLSSPPFRSSMPVFFHSIHIFLQQEFCNPNYILIGAVQTLAKLNPWLYQIQCCQLWRVSRELYDVMIFCKASPSEESCSRENLRFVVEGGKAELHNHADHTWTRRKQHVAIMG